ncbi:ABC-type transport system involved in multi-copper enzyme maturation permease subunit [Nocardioides thalensis]|uniref:ABC-type transport system involved in multi-copper enzyme maturation permease subunit n=1 Tax=Nocardioides thalensis TaxID=1914755 RepID=A0A853BYV1_9ACTN|nr:ABC transporter permease [Nocardioides thalensis]NYJ00395.1 ABC-type transport system involved in multi-copper enzyme maturation permease subunit [Nocardioides thalensis]
MTAATITLDVTGTPATPFDRLVAVELRKIVDTRAGRWLLGAIIAITAIVMTIFFFAAPEDERTFSNFMGIAATPQGFLLPVLGILLVTSEWSQRTAMVTFALEPSRSRVVAAKTVSAMIWGAGAFVAAVVIGTLATVAAGAPGAWDDVGGEMVLLFFLLQLITIMQGLAYGMLLLNTPAAIVTFFVLPIASSIVFSLVSALEDAAPWIDLGTAQTPLFEGATDLTGEMYAQLGVTSLIWIVLPFVAGWFRILRAELK